MNFSTIFNTYTYNLMCIYHIQKTKLAAMFCKVNIHFACLIVPTVSVTFIPQRTSEVVFRKQFQ